MERLWKSEDGYVVVADDLTFPDENDLDTRSDLETLFRAHAWIVVWRATERREDDRWYVTRSRQMPKPSLNALRAMLRLHVDDGIADAFRIAPEDRCGSIATDDPIAVAQALYRAWGYVALEVLPREVEQRSLNPDDYDPMAVRPWLRPGIPLHQERRRDFRELKEELLAEAA
jgi:hypothetical protein